MATSSSSSGRVGAGRRSTPLVCRVTNPASFSASRSPGDWTRSRTVQRGERPRTRASSPECRSRSTRSVRRPWRAKHTARFVEITVLPEPPLVENTVKTCASRPAREALGRLCTDIAAARRAREARALAAAMPSDWDDCGRQSTSSTPRCIASSNQRLGWSSVRATMPGPCGSASAARSSAGRPSLSDGRCQTSTSGADSTISTMPDRSKRSRIDGSSAWRATRMRSGCIGRAPVTLRGRRSWGRRREARRARAAPRWRRGRRPGRPRWSSTRRPGRCRRVGERVCQVRGLVLGQPKQDRALRGRVAGLGRGGRRHVHDERAGGQDVRSRPGSSGSRSLRDVHPVAGVDVAGHPGVGVDGQPEGALVPGDPGRHALVVGRRPVRLAVSWSPWKTGWVRTRPRAAFRSV